MSRWISQLVLSVALTFVAACARDGELRFREPGQITVKRAEVRPEYASIRQLILVPKCIGCHNEGSESPHGIDLTTYENILDQTLFPPIITPGEPENSSLYLTIAEGKMPKKGPKLSDQEIQAVFDWIKNGAKENP